jgi:hypothetical protein
MGMLRTGTGVVLAIALVGVSTAAAQAPDQARSTIEQKANPGDRLTITTRDGARSKGRLVDVGADALVVQAADGHRRVSYTDIIEVRGYRNRIPLGVAIGAGAGFLAGAPLRSWANNEGADGDRILTTFLVAGTGLGALLAALSGNSRAIYRRPPDAGSGLDLQPQKGGGAVRWTVRW